jgi:hypothetical protein
MILFWMSADERAADPDAVVAVVGDGIMVDIIPTCGRSRRKVLDARRAVEPDRIVLDFGDVPHAHGCRSAGY